MRKSGDMSCKELVELVTDYLEGSLSSDERQRFEDHLKGCSGCRRYLHQMQQTIQLVGKLTEADLAPSIQQELLTVFRTWKAAG